MNAINKNTYAHNEHIGGHGGQYWQGIRQVTQTKFAVKSPVAVDMPELSMQPSSQDSLASKARSRP
jgi:hypothetical protein